ncbi:MAG: hypothetical protein WAN36_16195 [Calditrichia bacterium]
MIQRVSGEIPEVLDLVFLNEDALQMTLQSRELFIYRRSKMRIEKCGEAHSEIVPVSRISVCRNQRALLITIRDGFKKYPVSRFESELSAVSYSEISNSGGYI